MKNVFTKAYCLCLIFISLSLSAGPLGGSRETSPGEDPFTLLKNIFEEKEISDSKISSNENESLKFEKVFFDNLTDNFYDIKDIKENVYGDLPINLKEQLIPYNIELLFLDSILKGDDAGFFLLYDKHYPKVFEIHKEAFTQHKLEANKLYKLEEQLYDRKNLSPSQIQIIEKQIAEQRNQFLVITANLRKWEDFTRFLVNKNAPRYEGGIKENGWIDINPKYKYFNERGAGVTVWSVLNMLSNASIYYDNFEFLKADLAAHDAMLNFLSLDFSSYNNPNIDLFMKDLAFHKLLQYFYEKPADKRLCRLLINNYLSARNLSKDPINNYIAIKLSFLINSVNGQFYKKINYEPQNLKPEMQNTGVNAEFIDLNNINIFEEIVNFTLRLYFEGEPKEARDYWNTHKIKTELFFYEDIVEGFINNSESIPSVSTQAFFDLIDSDENLTGSYTYLYSKLFKNLIDALSLRNTNQLKKSDASLIESINFLEKIANVYIHPPGTTLPSIFLTNGLLLELLVEFTMKSGLSDEDKNRVIETASTLSLSAEELQYVDGQELIQNTQSSYAKDISIKLTNNMIKREMIYEGLFYRSLSKNSLVKKINVNDIYALDQINSILHNAQLYLSKDNKVKRKSERVRLIPDKDEIIINLFCLEINCYAYKKTEDGFDLTSVNKNKLFFEKDRFFDSIVEGEILNEGDEFLGNFLFGKFNLASDIKKCNIIATSGLSNIPFATLSLNRKFLIDRCDIGLYSSIMHLQRTKNEAIRPNKEKWALSIADPIIRSEAELDSIEKTAALIRGIQLDELSELPETEAEALAIIGKNSKNSLLLSRKDATKENILKQNLSQYEIVSFSTHGLMAGETENNYHPAILISNSKDGNLLTTADILDLSGSPKIVLLAICNASNNVNNLKISEINNIANAFLLKGSDAVISTYWSLNSNASVMIIKNALKYYNQGIDLNLAFQKSSIEYKNLYPDSNPKDWGAFFVIGNTKKIETVIDKYQKAEGFVYDLAKINDKIFLLGKNTIVIFNHDLTFIESKTFEKVHLGDEEIYDSKFINQKALSFLQVSNKYISLINTNAPDFKINRLTIPIDDYASKYGLLSISSIASDEGNILFAIKNFKDSNMLIGKFDVLNQRYETYSHNSKNADNLSWLTNAAFHKEDEGIYLLDHLDAPNAIDTTIYSTRSGIPTYCKHNKGVGIANVAKNFTKPDDVYHLDTQLGQALPTFSREKVTHIIAQDKCSDKSEINIFPKNIKKRLGQEELPFKGYDNFFEMSLGKGPWRVNNFSQFNNVIITHETFFPLVTGIDASNEILSSYGETEYSSLSYGRTFNAVAYRKNGEKQILSNALDCNAPIGLEEAGVLYAVCNEKDGYYNLRKYD